MSNYSITVWVILTTILSVPEILISGQQQQQQQQVPCLFLFGDDQFDNGNNNGLPTTAKANYPPYGIDYPGAVSTGRFTNGDNVADFLAKLLGFNASIPPHATTSGSNVLRGLNYASGGSGILPYTGGQLGYGIPLYEQLINHEKTITLNEVFLRNKTATEEYLRQCLYVVNTGSNDYINYYLKEISTYYRFVYPPASFAKMLLKELSHQLMSLYSLGARKIAVFGVGLIGCIPQELALYPPTNGSACVDDINRAVRLFNAGLVSIIKRFNRDNYDLPNARFTYINATNIARGDPSLVGLKVLNAPCCEVQEINLAKNGQCVRNGAVCSNRNEYAFFDNIHPTQILNNVTASRSYNALSPADAFPVDIRTLVNLQLKRMHACIIVFLACMYSYFLLSINHRINKYKS